jgi:aryl-alcohol dehydrogenase-like predicted oxidoreductase
MIERAPFGRTGHDSSRVIFGAAGLGGVSQDEADAVLSLLLEHRINHIDTAASYGAAELRIGPWMAAHRSDFFLATKTGDRDGAVARASLEHSLERLQVDKIDLIQLHNLVEEDEWDAAFSPGGAVESLQAARDEGLVDHIGVTGHGLRIPAMHRRSLERFDFASVLFPFNAPLLADTHYRLEVEALIATCVERQVAIQTIKSTARRRWADPAAPHERRLSWYEPLRESEPIGRAVGYVLSRPELFLLTSSDWRTLPDILAAAQRPIAPDEDVVLADRHAHGTEALFTSELERI